MLYNYFNIALRNLLKNRIHTTINVIGLGLGIASVFLISLYIQHELSYDRFHDHPENLYRVTWEDENPQTRTPHPMAQALVHDFPEVESAVSLSPLWGAGLTRETHSFRNLEKDERYDEKNILAVDTTFFKVFSFKLIKGDPKTVLKHIRGVLISQSMAKKYFGNEDPLGKQLAVDSDTQLAEVVGVFEDVPENSHFHFDFLVSYVREKYLDPENPYYSWKDFGHYNYVRLKPGTDAKQLEGKLLAWFKKYFEIPPEYYQYLVKQGYGFKLQPVTDIHLHSRLRWELEPNGNIDYIYILATAALLTLIIACVNFMNLTTAKSAERAKEIGVRKTVGALRSQLSTQFLAESVTIALLGILFSVLIIQIVLPFFNYATGFSFQMNYGKHLIVLFALGILIGLLSGVYPSVYLSAIKPHAILKGKLMQTPKGSGLRRGLIVFQFSISMMLISAAIIIFDQLDYIKNKNLGFDKEEVVVVPLKNDEGVEHFGALRNELLKIDGITSVSAASNIPGKQFNQHFIATVTKPEDHISSSEAFVDYDFFKTMDIRLAGGRFFLRENPSDSSGAFILNETAAKQLFFGAPAVGKEIFWGRDGYEMRGTVVGVVKDFHFQSLHEPIQPLLFALSAHAFNYILIKTNTKDFAEKIAAVEKTYKKIEPYFSFEFSFLEDQLNAQYAAEERTADILGVFSVIAIVVACFGLFAMSMLTFNQKIKEISVRKVLGASSLNLLVLLLGDFTKLILVAVVLATPLAWWIMNGWLDNFSYQVHIHPVIFIGSGLLLVGIAWITLSYFTVRASRLNPAEILKSE